MSVAGEPAGQARGIAVRRPPQPPPIYAIADAETLAPTPVAAAAGRMAAAGIGWIQVRAKRLSDAAMYGEVAGCLRRLRSSGAALWVNDRADLAALLPVAGLHLGQDDLPPAVAREVVGAGTWIGRSTHDVRQVREAEDDPDVDVVAFGPVFATATKRRSAPVVGLEGLRQARALTSKPLVAIGGIDSTNLAAVLAAGADAVAVVGAVCRGDLEENCRRLLRAAAAR